MNPTATQNLITNALADFGAAILIIFAAVIVVSVGVLVYNYGWRMFTDQSIQLGGYYLRKKPYKNYNRFRSKAWNMKNTM